MFVRAKRRFKDGKEHRYWSVVENCRNRDGRVVQRQVLYLGEINDSQRAAWCRSIEVLRGDSGPVPMALFADDREAPELDCETVRINVKDLSLHHPRQWGACWLALTLWDRLELDRFWGPRLPVSRQGTRWLDVLKTQVCYQLIDPGSEWRLHRHWYEHSAMGDLLSSPMGVVADDVLYRCLDKLLAHKRALFSFLRERWETLFDARFDVLLYDLTTSWNQKSAAVRPAPDPASATCNRCASPSNDPAARWADPPPRPRRRCSSNRRASPSAPDRTNRMGQRDLLCLLVLGAMAVIRHAHRRKEIPDPPLRHEADQGRRGRSREQDGVHDLGAGGGG